jgi:hypothetical protein
MGDALCSGHGSWQRDGDQRGGVMGDRRDYWRDPTKYPDAESTSLHRWALEFLWRNPEFRAEYEAVIARLRQPDGSLLLNVDSVDLELARWGVRSFRGIGEALPGDSPWMFDLAPRTLRSDAPASTARLVLEFDIDTPLDPQIERARHILNAEQQKRFPELKRGRNQVQKFPLYLRVLDAADAGASQKEMVDVFAANDARAVRKWKARAIALRDGGYRDLIAQQ